MVNLTSSMVLVPYLLVAAYESSGRTRGDYGVTARKRRGDLTVAGIAILYTAFMVYAGGLKFVLFSAVLYAPGTILFVWTRREQEKAVFTMPERALFLAI